MNVLEEPMLARRQLRLSVAADLKKIEGLTVISPGVLPTQEEDLPAVLVNVPSARKQSNVRSVTQFTTTITVQIQGRILGVDEADAQEKLERLEYQVEEAVLMGHWTRRIIQLFPSVTSDNEVRPEGKKFLAGFRMQIECETFEVFDETAVIPTETPWPPAGPTPMSPLQGVNLHVDAVQPADPSGTYPPGPFPAEVTPAPRTQGPDGRDEGYLQIDLPQ